MQLDIIHIDSDEKIVLKLRKHWIILLRDTSGTILMGILPFFSIPLIIGSGLIPFTIVVAPAFISFSGALWLLIIWMALSVLWTNYYLDLWIVTDRRIISLDQMGLFNRRVTTWDMEHIQEVSIKTENPLQAFIGYGTIEIETAGPTAANARMEGIPDPEQVRKIILQEAGHFKKLEETNKKQEGLLHTISHEVKSYLTKSAAALAAISQGDLGVVPSPVKKIADSALSETRRGVDTVVGMLDASNFKSGTMTLERKKFDMKSAILQIAEDIRPDAERKKLAFDVLTEDGSYECEGDEAKLRRHVFRNLMDNAVRYTKEGGVHVLLSRNGPNIIFSVKDTGVGIIAEDMQHLFTEGGKGKNSEKVNPESTGYGLFVARGIVEAHGGRIWAESDGEGKGAQFFVQLPA